MGVATLGGGGVLYIHVWVKMYMYITFLIFYFAYDK